MTPAPASGRVPVPGQPLPRELRLTLHRLLATRTPDTNELRNAAGELCHALTALYPPLLRAEARYVAQQLCPQMPDRVVFPVSDDESGNSFAAAQFLFADGRTVTATEAIGTSTARREALWYSQLDSLLGDYNTVRSFHLAMENYDQEAQAPEALSIDLTDHPGHEAPDTATTAVAAVPDLGLWAVGMSQDALVPQSVPLTRYRDGIPDARLHLAFAGELDPERRTALTNALKLALRVDL